jgi:hypothetical protein
MFPKWSLNVPLQETLSMARSVDHTAALKSVSVVGATVLSALIHMDAIAASHPKAILFEEAAEIPEATLISLLRLPSLQR